MENIKGAEMNRNDWGSFRDIREIWDAIDKEYKSFPEKYASREKASIEV